MLHATDVTVFRLRLLYFLFGPGKNSTPRLDRGRFFCLGFLFLFYKAHTLDIHLVQATFCFTNSRGLQKKIHTASLNLKKKNKKKTTETLCSIHKKQKVALVLAQSRRIAVTAQTASRWL